MKVRVSAPSRIHFGLFSIGKQTDREFGGAGLMLKSPRTTIELEPASRFEIRTSGETTDTNEALTSKATEFATRWYQHVESLLPVEKRDAAGLPHCRINVLERPPQHAGFGSGTQFGLSIICGLNTLFEIGNPSIQETILMAGRARRSAIGSYGFFKGGFLVERGRATSDPVSPLDFQDPFPDWPVVVAVARNQSKVFGQAEAQAFQNLPATPADQRDSITDRVREYLIPALMKKDFDSFSEEITNLGIASGRLFESIQGGVYNGEEVSRTVTAMREFGIQGTGQSSWGPAVFGLTQDMDQATALAQFLGDKFPQHELFISTADNRGANVETLEWS